MALEEAKGRLEDAEDQRQEDQRERDELAQRLAEAVEWKERLQGEVQRAGDAQSTSVLHLQVCPALCVSVSVCASVRLCVFVALPLSRSLSHTNTNTSLLSSSVLQGGGRDDWESADDVLWVGAGAAECGGAGGRRDADGAAGAAGADARRRRARWPARAR
eukprot:3591152-Rhodomonas_salina.2